MPACCGCTCRPARRTGDDDDHVSSGRMLNWASALVCGPCCRYADNSPTGDLHDCPMRKYYQYAGPVPRSDRSGRVPHEPPPASMHAGFIFSVAPKRLMMSQTSQAVVVRLWCSSLSPSADLPLGALFRISRTGNRSRWARALAMSVERG